MIIAHSYLIRKQSLFFLLQQDQITQFKGTHEHGVWLILTLVGLFPSQRNMTTIDLHPSSYISSQSFPSLTDQSFHRDTHTHTKDKWDLSLLSNRCIYTIKGRSQDCIYSQCLFPIIFFITVGKKKKKVISFNKYLSVDRHLEGLLFKSSSITNTILQA